MTATIDDVRRELEDLAAWRSGLSDAVDTILGISSPRLSTDGRGSSNGMALPFHLSAAVDEPDLGGAGVRTEAGLLDLLGSWARSIAHDRGEHVTGSPLTYLHTTLTWAQQHADWDGLAGDVRDAWIAVGRIVGHGPVTIGTCPWDGGKILTDPREFDPNEPEHSGIPEHGECETCERWYADQDDIARAAHKCWQEQMRSTNVDETETATMDRLATIWEGEVDRNTLETWAKRGHLIKRKGSKETVYLLRLANLWITERQTYVPKETSVKKEVRHDDEGRMTAA